MRVTVWNEFVHEQHDEAVQAIYPDGIHAVLAEALRARLDGAEVGTATLDEPEHGLPDSVLDETDVLLWWGHIAHGRVDDKVAERVQQRVLDGMGLVALHSAHYSKPFKLLMGTSCSLTWRETGEAERVWTVLPGHPIAAGVPQPLVIPEQEVYGEFFDIPAPDELVFISTFSESPEPFRSGCAFYRGRGRVFYFSPGHETHPVFHQPEVQQVIANAVRWAAAS